MKTYIVAPTHAAFDATIRERDIHRPDAVRIRRAEDVRGLTLERGQVIQAYGSHLLPDYSDVLAALDVAYLRGGATSADDKRTHRLTITDLDGNTIGTRLVTERQAKDALG